MKTFISIAKQIGRGEKLINVIIKKRNSKKVDDMIKYFCDRCGTEVTYGWYIQHSSDPYLWCETCVSGVSLNTSLIETEYSEEKAKLETWHTGQITDLYASNEYEFEEYEN